eukprot:SAG31_NODE_28871_length_404_cov_0.836066_1_plen_82_part_01
MVLGNVQAIAAGRVGNGLAKMAAARCGTCLGPCWVPRVLDEVARRWWLRLDSSSFRHSSAAAADAMLAGVAGIWNLEYLEFN